MKLCCLQMQFIVHTVPTGQSGDSGMANTRNRHLGSSQPMSCQIRVDGHLSQQWADWFEGLTITLQDNGETLLAGPVADQAALHGLLKRVRDLGIPLLSVTCTRDSWAEAPEVNEVPPAHSEKEN